MRLEEEMKAIEARLAAEEEDERRRKYEEKRNTELEAEQKRMNADRELWIKEQQLITQIFINYLKARSDQLMEVGRTQQELANNRLFNVHALFADIDARKQGYLTVEQFEAWAQGYDLKRLNWHRVAKLLNSGKDGDSPTQCVYFDELSISLIGSLPHVPPEIVEKDGYPVEVLFTEADKKALKNDHVSQ